MEFTYQQKIAIMRILLDIIYADGIIDARETYFFNELKKKFCLADEDEEAVKSKNSLIALAQIKQLDEEQKITVAHLMSKMIVVDEDINVNETAIYDIVAETCGIKVAIEDSVGTDRFNGCSKS